jgi:hypothetical protein
MNKIRISLCLVLPVMFMGCSSKPLLQKTGTPTLEAVITQSVLSTKTLTPFVESKSFTSTPTPTSSINTPTITPSIISTNAPMITPSSISTIIPTITPTIPPEERLKYECLEVAPDPPTAGKYAGTIVLAGYKDTPTYLLDLSTWSMRPLLEEKDEKTLFETVSPNRRLLAYKISPFWLIIETVDGSEPPIKISWEARWSGGINWLDDRNLLIPRENGYTVYNPFTGERKGVSNDFPDHAEPVGVGADFWDVVYNSDLTRAVYPRYPGIVNANGEYGTIVIWDMQTNKVLNSLKTEGGIFGGEPVWSPSGEEFVMALGYMDSRKGRQYDNLYKVTQDGLPTKLTNLDGFLISHYSWSPDANQIAFRVDNDTGNQLAILNLTTMMVTNYCIGMANVHEPPIWSPDGKQLVIPTFSNDTYETFLLDLDEGIAYKIAEGNFRPVGWMVSTLPDR